MTLRVRVFLDANGSSEDEVLEIFERWLTGDVERRRAIAESVAWARGRGARLERSPAQIYDYSSQKVVPSDSHFFWELVMDNDALAVEYRLLYE